jgi:chloride channel protein, CIC family
MIYVLFISFGQYYVEGVGYAAIQDILNGGLAVPGLLGILFICKLIATSVSLGSGSSGGIFSPALFMGATVGGMFGAVLHSTYPVAGIGVTGSAIIGMAAMVGGATGAAMTAVTMLFEMTRDYSLVMPMIVAVAIAIGIRRLLSRENIYTIKLVGRRHFIPKALHANMFLVRHARDVMDRSALILPAKMDFDEFLRRPELSAQMQHVVVCEGDRIVGGATRQRRTAARLSGDGRWRYAWRGSKQGLHDRARGGCSLQCHSAHVAAACDDGGRGPWRCEEASCRPCRRRHFQRTRG